MALPAQYTNSAFRVNYVRTKEALGPFPTVEALDAQDYHGVREMTQYIDGLGRPLQTVQRQATYGSTPQDVVAPVVYDAFGRETYKYLPYVQTTGPHNTDGRFKTTPFTDQKNFYTHPDFITEQPAYTGEQVFYSQTNYEASPLNRVEKTLAPGNSWAGSDKGISVSYEVNTHSDGVRIWNIANTNFVYDSATDNAANIPVSPSTYTPSATDAPELYKTVTTDENDNKVIEYKDKSGQIILKKIQDAASPSAAHDGWLCTYYVYDDFGLLRFVIPPKAVKWLSQHSWDFNDNPSEGATVVKELCFRYEYDGRNRMIAKQVPGGGWTYLLYDKRDRLVYTQDANLRSQNRWLISFYDELNRPVMTAMLQGGTPSQLLYHLDQQTTFVGSSTTVNGAAPGDLYTDNWQPGRDYVAPDNVYLTDGFESQITGPDFEVYNGPGTGSSSSVTVTGNPVPSGLSWVALTMTFYDDYAWKSGSEKPFTYQYATKLEVEAGTHPFREAYPTAEHTALKGMVTGTKVRTLPDSANIAAGVWHTSVTYYDAEYRPVQVQSDNIKGGTDIVSTRYDFTGKPIAICQVTDNPAAGATAHMAIVSLNTYDHVGRLLTVVKKIYKIHTQTSPAEVRTIVSNTYDQLGQLKNKVLGQKRNSDGTLSTTEPVESLAYDYNIRGWLKGINNGFIAATLSSTGTGSRWFGMDLSYDWGYGTNQYNGNIAGMKWRSRGDGEKRSYGFGYDRENRLLYGDFAQEGSSGYVDHATVNYDIMMGNGAANGSAYDENGNIKAMRQWGMSFGTSGVQSQLVDDLSYTYTQGGLTNKLQHVKDSNNLPLTNLGDFRSSLTYMSALSNNKTASAVDYSYDGNGNLKKDLNKDIGTDIVDGITYNHLNLPWKIKVENKGSIKYLYDAAGNKLQKIIQEDGKPEKITDYIAGAVYESDILQFIEHEEGRMRLATQTIIGGCAAGNNQWLTFDYMVKDHLGNVRMTLTDEWQQDNYPYATMEDATVATEDVFYDKLYDTRTNALPGGYPAASASNQWASKLNKNNHPVGPGILLKVMAGDRISLQCDMWYRINSASPDNSGSHVLDVLLPLLTGSVKGMPGTKAGAISSDGSFFGGAVSDFLSNHSPNTNGQLRAGVYWILLNEQFGWQSGNGSGSELVGADNTPKHFVKDCASPIEVQKSGYIYIYTANQSNIDVYFDNLQVSQMHSPLLEETHYYPFGLTMAGISSKAAGKTANKKLYSGNELQSNEFNDGSGLEFYDFNARTYDHQIGRFLQIDSMSEKREWLTVYNYCQNNTISRQDRNGKFDNYYMDREGNLLTVVRIQGAQVDNFYRVSDDGKQVTNFAQRSLQATINNVPNGWLAVPDNDKVALIQNYETKSKSLNSPINENGVSKSLEANLNAGAQRSTSASRIIFAYNTGNGLNLIRVNTTITPITSRMANPAAVQTQATTTLPAPANNQGTAPVPPNSFPPNLPSSLIPQITVTDPKGNVIPPELRLRP